VAKAIYNRQYDLWKTVLKKNRGEFLTRETRRVVYLSLLGLLSPLTGE
jgi:hypothetical protein|tara:strand:- start:101 stop:244 length:144 start_codon:yes stop_codon:yes gene_type:complete